ncbi:hypothetical protein [Acetobacter oeni]|uniref:Uncharacterized protein n=1 Tax=Acetobacter oeni TaxID=304077 RepID=A0A511XJ16_9PROT|nr:hypothetical protein [Acetobacter oeni]MBB3882682.1 hypothetical protein [Acetobacter oeni]NHO18785.1 hypothetical protein [Acetobacter oeni]GBR06995.1 hypothetical protein AA21952_2196 [Acetobacter oeni LMG 21952]GEN62937.1 hypothetical protein AOE01nite_11610 [Acetobacter oeni]
MVKVCEIEALLAKILADYIYPDSLIDSMTSAIGYDVKICRGWPQETELGKDLKSSPAVSWITINQKSGTAVDKTRYNRGWHARSCNNTFGISSQNAISGDSVTFQGVAASDGVAGIVIDNVAYPVAVKTGYTAELIAQLIEAVVENIGQVSVLCSDSTLSVAAPHTMYGRVGKSIVVTRELSRTEQTFNISIFAPSILIRDILEQAVMTAVLENELTETDKNEIGYFIFAGREVDDSNLNTNLYRLNLLWKIEIGWTQSVNSVPALWPVGIVNSDWAFGVGGENMSSVLPPLGAIRFDAWHDMSNVIDEQCAAALNSEEWFYRLPGNAIISAENEVAWPTATQESINQEISDAISCGLSFWAFESYPENDSLSLALSFYLSSNSKKGLQFCMIGQPSNWADTTSCDGYTDTFKRDIMLMGRDEYMTVLSGRPLYFIINRGNSQLAKLPGGLSRAIGFIRESVLEAHNKNPYIVYLSDSAISDYDNADIAKSVGADAAGAYCNPRLSGSPQTYSALVNAAETDWNDRVNSGFPMIPTAMTGWDQRPLIENPQAFYPISSELSSENYYEAGTATDIASHIMNMTTFIKNASECPAGVGLIYAWNQFTEGGWLSPTYSATYSASSRNTDRISVIGSSINNAAREGVYPDIPFIA